MRLLLYLLPLVVHTYSSRDNYDSGSYEEEDDDEVENKNSGENNEVYEFLYKRMKQDAARQTQKRPVANVYTIPGPQEPLPGRSHLGDYWPVFPFQNQYSGGLDLDPSISRHIGGDFNLAVPSWGMLDIYGRWFNRISDTTSKFGYLNHPVNMMDLEREDFVKLMSDPSLHHNRRAQPRLPLGKVSKSYTPLNCRPPLCNPYQMTFGLGIEHDWGGHDGVEGDIDVPIPISKGVAYRLPLAGKVYYDFDNLTITYGQNIAPIDPFASLFDYQKTRDPNLRIPRRSKRHVSFSDKVWQSEPTSKTFGEYVHNENRMKRDTVTVASSQDQILPFAEEFLDDFPEQLKNLRKQGNGAKPNCEEKSGTNINPYPLWGKPINIQNGPLDTSLGRGPIYVEKIRSFTPDTLNYNEEQRKRSYPAAWPYQLNNIEQIWNTPQIYEDELNDVAIRPEYTFWDRTLDPMSLNNFPDQTQSLPGGQETWLPYQRELDAYRTWADDYNAGPLSYDLPPFSNYQDSWIPSESNFALFSESNNKGYENPYSQRIRNQLHYQYATNKPQWLKFYP